MAGKSSWTAGTTGENRDPEAIRADIEDTRAKLSVTVEEIKERLSPEHLKSEAMEKLREATVGRLKNGMSERAASLLNESPAARRAAYNALTAAFFGVSFGRHLFRMLKTDGRSRLKEGGSGKTATGEGLRCGPSTTG